MKHTGSTKEYNREAQKRFRARRKEAGLCRRCGEPKEKGNAEQCDVCKKAEAQDKARRKAEKARLEQAAKAMKEKGWEVT